MIEVVLGGLLWNPTLALVPFIAGLAMFSIMGQRSIVSAVLMCVAVAFVALYVGTTAFGAHLGAMDLRDSEAFRGFIYSAALLGVGYAIRLYGLGRRPWGRLRA